MHLYDLHWAAFAHTFVNVHFAFGLHVFLLSLGLFVEFQENNCLMTPLLVTFVRWRRTWPLFMFYLGFGIFLEFEENSFLRL